MEMQNAWGQVNNLSDEAGAFRGKIILGEVIGAG